MYNLLQDEKVNYIINKLDTNELKLDKISFNIFSISKYGSHLENFHSDILAKLLDPKAEHEEGDLFLKTFLKYVNSKGANINLNDFRDPNCIREKGRIDILITDNSTQKAIIIENKINNAVDMDNQLKRYYDWCTEKNYEVASVVYLTLSGEKLAPQLPDNYQTPVINIEAFTNTSDDLVNGWISPCIGQCKTFDTASFLRQYQKLLINLGYEKMNTKALNEFYTIADDMSVLEKINKLKALADGLPEHRINNLVTKLKDYKPFTKTYRYKPFYMTYECFVENDNSFKLDIYYENGDAHIHFWNPGKAFNEGLPLEEYFKTIQDKIQEIGYEDDLIPTKDGWIGYFQKFSFSKYGSMKQQDEALYIFVRDFMKALNAKFTEK